MAANVDVQSYNSRQACLEPQGQWEQSLHCCNCCHWPNLWLYYCTQCLMFYFHNLSFWVWSPFEFCHILSFWVCHSLNFLTIWVFITIWVLSQVVFLSFGKFDFFRLVTIWDLSFIIIWIYEFHCNLHFLGLSQFAFWSFIKIWFFEFHQYLSFWVSSKFEFLGFIPIWAFEFHHNLSFRVSSEFQILSLSTIWVFMFFLLEKVSW